MAGKRQPIELLLLKGNKNLTKKEIEERKASEPKGHKDKIKAPSYLTKELKKEFNKLAAELVRIDIFTNLDVDALARFIIAQATYIKVTNELLTREPILTREVPEYDNDGMFIGTLFVDYPNDVYTELLNMQDKVFKQCRSSAADLGLTISSRCKLVIPKKEEPEKPKSKEERLFGDV
jgi:P27 family predicted phage terminase small subunit